MNLPPAPADQGAPEAHGVMGDRGAWAKVLLREESDVGYRAQGHFRALLMQGHINGRVALFVTSGKPGVHPMPLPYPDGNRFDLVQFSATGVAGDSPALWGVEIKVRGSMDDHYPEPCLQDRNW
jgi:hypothetical protein